MSGNDNGDTDNGDIDDDELLGPPELKLPITVTSIEFEETPPLKTQTWRHQKCGTFVVVRPCEEKFGNKTYLGILLGEIALSQGCRFKREEGKLTICRSFYNPAILIPEMGEVVYGCGSWWGAIKKPEDLRDITNVDIDNVWYVQAIKKLQEMEQNDAGDKSEA